MSWEYGRKSFREHVVAREIRKNISHAYIVEKNCKKNEWFSFYNRNIYIYYAEQFTARFIGDILVGVKIKFRRTRHDPFKPHSEGRTDKGFSNGIPAVLLVIIPDPCVVCMVPPWHDKWKSERQIRKILRDGVILNLEYRTFYPYLFFYKNKWIVNYTTVTRI